GGPASSACTYGCPWICSSRFSPGPGSAGSAEDVDGALAQRDDRALGVLAATDPETGAAGLALAVDRVHRGDLDAREDLLDRDLDLGLARAGVHEERVLALVEQVVALLGHHRRDDDVVRVLGADGAHLASSSVSSATAASAASGSAELADAVTERPLTGPATNCSSASAENTTSSETSTS